MQPPQQSIGKPSHNSRIVVVEQIYFQSESMPVPNEVRFVRHLNTDEQPYQRHIKVGEKWQQLDCGWIEKCSMLLIEHELPHWQVNPEIEERVEVMSRVISISLRLTPLAATHSKSDRVEDDSPCLLIPIGESLRISPDKPDHVWLRCNTPTRCKITLYPG